MADTHDIGAAAVHIVCADLLLSGHKAFIAGEGLQYDVVMDFEGRLFRIQVKGTLKANPRTHRPNAPPSYRFETQRNRATMSGPRLYASYDNSKIDILACVAIDIRRVAYFPVFGKFQSAIHLFESGVDSYLRGSKAERRRIDEYPIAAALQGATGGLVARQ